MHRRNQDRHRQRSVKYGPRQHVWVKLKMEPTNRERCRDQVMSWNCVVQLKYRMIDKN